MINAKSIFRVAMAALLFASLPSCSSSEENGGEPSGNSRGSIKLSRLDLTGAKYLTLGSTSAQSRSNSDNVLFKVDENGEVSAVVLECIEGEDGSSATVREDINVHPREARYLTSTWMYLFDCSFSSKDSEAVRRLWNTYNTQGSFYFNILVNKKTGKLFYIPDAYHEYFWLYGNYDDDSFCFLDGPDGELYTQAHPIQGVSRVSITSSGEAKIEKLGPADKAFSGWQINVSDNGTVSLVNGNSVTMLYLNNGFETVMVSSHDFREYDEEANFQIIDGKIMAVVFVAEYELDEYRWPTKGTQTITVKEFFPGPSFNTWSYSNPELEISQDVEFQYGRPIGDHWEYDLGNLYLHESQNYYFIGSNIKSLAIEKSTHKIIRLSGIEMDIIFPDEKNQYDGKAWVAWIDAASWFDCNTLEHGTIYYDTSSLNDYEVIDGTPNIPEGEYMLTALSHVDGRKVVLTIDITTGQVKNVSEFDTTAASIILIPMN